MINKENQQRNKELLAYRLSGHSYKECGEAFQITGSRARFIINQQAHMQAKEKAQQMAKSGASLKEISSALLQSYAPAAGWLDKTNTVLIAENALVAAGRFDEVALNTGFWDRVRKPIREDAMTDILARSIILTKEDIISCYNANIFMAPESGVFALALHQKFHYPIRKRTEDGRYFCESEFAGRPVYIDVRGITTDWSWFCYAEEAGADEMSIPANKDEVKRDAIQRMGETDFGRLLEAADRFIASLRTDTFDMETVQAMLQRRANEGK